MQKTQYEINSKFKNPNTNSTYANINFKRITNTKQISGFASVSVLNDAISNKGCAEKLANVLFHDDNNKIKLNKDSFKNKVTKIKYIPIYQDVWDETIKKIKATYNDSLGGKASYTDSIDEFIEYINKDDSNTNQEATNTQQTNTDQQDNKPDKTKHYNKTKK